MKTLCLQCKSPLSNKLSLSLGELPACNRFERQIPTDSDKYPLSISACPVCGLIQLSEHPPVDFVCPRVAWIKYNEPSAHLSQVSKQLLRLLPQDRAHVVGIGPFDAPLLDKLAPNIRSKVTLDVAAVLRNQENHFPYLESIQELLRSEPLSRFAMRTAQADLVSCRYLLEHSHAPIESLMALRQLLKPSGYLLIEVPDSKKFLAASDYSFIWEEHICYFTETTFHACARRAGYSVVTCYRYEGALEDALVFVLRDEGSVDFEKTGSMNSSEIILFERYINNFGSVRARYQEVFKEIRDRAGKVALFGAGHQSIMFINILGLQDKIAFVIDDAPEKQAYLIPGTSIPIVPSSRLMEDPSIEICLLGVNPTMEEKIRAQCTAFLGRGGKMYPIFPGASSDKLIDYSDLYCS